MGSSVDDDMQGDVMQPDALTAVHMQAFNNMASSGLVTRKFTRYRANSRESTSYMTETDCHPARSASRMVTCGPVR